MESEEQHRPRTRSAVREVVETLFFTLLIYLVVRTFLFENYRVVGSSMQPTLENGEYLVVNKLSYRIHPPQRGDIVVFRSPIAPDTKLIKRIIGLPDETVEIRNGQVFINETLLEEPYIAAPWNTTRAPAAVPSGSYFVLGDNRDNSSDSRSWGTLPGSQIIGKAFLTYWPPSMWGIVPHEAYGSAQSTGGAISPEPVPVNSE